MMRLEQFSQYSGYKLNIHKTQILTYNYVPKEKIRKMYDFKWNTNKLTYLGGIMPKDLTEIYNLDYNAITQNIKVDLGRWAPLTIGLYGRIEIVKMNVLPRLLFLFQSLPIEIPIKQFNEWKRMISQFIWQSKKPRV